MERIAEFKKNFSSMLADSNVLKPSNPQRVTPADSVHRPIGSFGHMGLPGPPVVKDAAQTQVLDMAQNLARSKKYYIESLISEMGNYERPVVAMNVEWHEKFSLSLACLILFFIGAPLGAIIRKGGLGMPVVVSVVIFILFFVISIIGKKMSQDGAIPVHIGMWISSVITIPIGIFLTSKATSDSSVLDTDSYLNFFKKLLPKKK